MFHMFGSMNMCSWDGCLPGACTWGKKKERNVRNLHWHGGWERKSPAFPVIRCLCPSQPRGVGGFSSHSILTWAALAILRQDCVDSGVRAGWHQIVTIVTAINLDWLAGWRQISERERERETERQRDRDRERERERERERLFHVATNSWFPEMRLFSPSPPPQVESLNSENYDRVLVKSSDISNQTFFF